MAAQKPPVPPKPRDWLPIFQAYITAYPGINPRELVHPFANSYRLTTTEESTLQAQVNKLYPETPKPPMPPKPPTPPKPKVPTELVITVTPYPKWWKDARAYMISLGDAGTTVQIAATPGYRTYITTIVLVADGETNITINMGVFGPSGPMHFGGDGGPRGMVIAMGNSPLPCGGGGLSVSSDGAGVRVGGFICYYYEKE